MPIFIYFTARNIYLNEMMTQKYLRARISIVCLVMVSIADTGSCDENINQKSKSSSFYISDSFSKKNNLGDAASQLPSIFKHSTSATLDANAQSFPVVHSNDLLYGSLESGRSTRFTSGSEIIASGDDLSMDHPRDSALNLVGPIDLFYDDGVNIKYDPLNFSMKMKFRIQNRYSFENYDTEGNISDKSEFLTRRVRLRLEGTALDPKWTYKLQFSFSRQDIDWDGSQFPNILRDANIGYQLTPHDQLTLGLAKLPGNRQRVISSGKQEFVDRSIANALLNIDRDVGLQWWHRFGVERPLWLKTALTNGQGRGSNQKDNGMSYTYRLEWLPLGNFKDNGDYFEGDLSFEESAKISLAVGMNKTFKASRVNGQTGLDISGGAHRDLETFIADILIKYRGWAWSSEYFRRNVDLPEITTSQTLFDGQAWNTQLSYTMRSMYLTGVRWAQVRPDNSVENSLLRENQFSVVFGRYLDHHNVKLQGDITFQPTRNASTGATLDNWIYRVQLELGI